MNNRAKSKRNAEQSAAIVALLALGEELPYKTTPTKHDHHS